MIHIYNFNIFYLLFIAGTLYTRYTHIYYLYIIIFNFFPFDVYFWPHAGPCGYYSENCSLIAKAYNSIVINDTIIVDCGNLRNYKINLRTEQYDKIHYLSLY